MSVDVIFEHLSVKDDFAWEKIKDKLQAGVGESA